MLRFLLGVTSMDKTRNVHFRGKSQTKVEMLGQDGSDMCRGALMHVKYGVTRQEGRKNITEKICGYSKGQHAEGWCDRNG